MLPEPKVLLEKLHCKISEKHDRSSGEQRLAYAEVLRELERVERDPEPQEVLDVQKFLRRGTGTLEDLKEQLGIKLTYHETKPLVILNYDQIESPKTNKIVRECRGLVLHSETYEIVARAFPRFFNWGEVASEMKDFDFSDFDAVSKEDGSLVLLYFYEGWNANTRGSFGEGKVGFSDFSWQELFKEALGIKDMHELDDKLNKHVTYVFELTSIHNKVVRIYPETKAYLLSGFCNVSGDELSRQECDDTSYDIGAKRPDVYTLKSIDEIQEYLQEVSSRDPTFEGVIIRDRQNRRWKIKSAKYIALHQMHGNGNVFNPKNLIPFVLDGETAELLTYFPEVDPYLRKVEEEMDSHLKTLLNLWHKCKDIESQKDFAIAVVGKTPFTGILFNARKNGEGVEKLWRQSGDAIYKILFRKKGKE